MWTSVPQTPARRRWMRTSFSRIVGSATFFNLNPGPADSLTSAFTRNHSVRCEPRARCGADMRGTARIETSHLPECDGSLRARAHKCAMTSLEHREHRHRARIRTCCGADMKSARIALRAHTYCV